MPAIQPYYAYAIFVRGRKVVGGALHAKNMVEAPRRIIAQSGGALTIERKPPVYRPADGASIPQAEWKWKGDKASVCLWIAPEYVTP